MRAHALPKHIAELNGVSHLFQQVSNKVKAFVPENIVPLNTLESFAIVMRMLNSRKM